MTEEAILKTADGALGDALRAGAGLAHIQTVEGVPVAVLPSTDGDWRTEVLDLERYQDAPRRKRGHVVARDVTSFIDYIKRHKTDATLAWADLEGGIVCYLNDHEPSALTFKDADGSVVNALVDVGRPGWLDHTITLRRVPTPGYTAWTTYSGKSLTQQQFAEFLEDRIGEVNDPPGGELLEVATFFQAHTKIAFTSARQLSNGQIQLQYNEEITESGGKAGETKVPTEFRLVLRPYRDAPAPPDGQRDPNVIVTSAKLRYRLSDQRVHFVFKLAEEFEQQMDGVHLAAIERVRAEAEIPVLLAGA